MIELMKQFLTKQRIFCSLFRWLSRTIVKFTNNSSDTAVCLETSFVYPWNKDEIVSSTNDKIDDLIELLCLCRELSPKIVLLLNWSMYMSFFFVFLGTITDDILLFSLIFWFWLACPNDSKTDFFKFALNLSISDGVKRIGSSSTGGVGCYLSLSTYSTNYLLLNVLVLTKWIIYCGHLASPFNNVQSSIRVSCQRIIAW